MIERVLCRCEPPRKTRTVTLLSGLLAACGAVLWIVSPYLGLLGLWRILGMLLICAGLYLVLRFVLHGYIYALEQHTDGRIDFSVTEQSGRRQVTVCRIDFADVTAIETFSRGKKPPAPEAGRRVYHYCAEFRPAVLTVLSVRDADGESSIRICPDAAFVTALDRLFGEKEILDGFQKTP